MAVCLLAALLLNNCGYQTDRNNLVYDKSKIALNLTFVNCSACMFGGAVYVGYIIKTVRTVGHVALDLEDSFFQRCRNNGSLSGAVHVASSRLTKTNIKKTKFRRSFSLGIGRTIAFVGPNWLMKSANKEDSVVDSKIVVSVDTYFTGSESFRGVGGRRRCNLCR